MSFTPLRHSAFLIKFYSRSRSEIHRRRLITISRYFQQRAKLAAMSRTQSKATSSEIEQQRSLVQAARKEFLLDEHIAALADGALEMTNEQRIQVVRILSKR
jgi:hypothetical protein